MGWWARGGGRDRWITCVLARVEETERDGRRVSAVGGLSPDRQARRGSGVRGERGRRAVNRSDRMVSTRRLDLPTPRVNGCPCPDELACGARKTQAWVRSEEGDVVALRPRLGGPGAVALTEVTARSVDKWLRARYRRCFDMHGSAEKGYASRSGDSAGGVVSSAREAAFRAVRVRPEPVATFALAPQTTTTRLSSPPSPSPPSRFPPLRSRRPPSLRPALSVPGRSSTPTAPRGVRSSITTITTGSRRNARWPTRPVG